VSRPELQVVVPFRGADAKTRLAALGDVRRRAVAVAMLLDTMAAVAASSTPVRLHLVTDDAGPARAAAGEAWPVAVHTDAPAGLNPALEYVLPRLDVGQPRAVLLADLPCLRPADVDALVVALRSEGRLVVPDAEGRGTTMLLAAGGEPLVPSFGRGSLARHLADGAEPIAAPATARQDVDDPFDLERAVELGVGPRTAAVLADRPLDVAALATG
jgi:2-phospho-L-lactate guanylyltransferase